MPVLREIELLVRRSIAERGAFRTMARCALVGPVYAWHRLQEIYLRPRTTVSEFDRRFGVDTDGATGNTTYLRDLDIASSSRLHGVDYTPVKPDRFRQALSALALPHEKFTFIDFGCGKGRAILLASEFPFRRLVGIDFSHELVAIARANWAVCRNPAQRCYEAEFVCADFLDYRIPPSPTVLFFYNPSGEQILAKVAENIRQDLTRTRRPSFILYLTPKYPHVWANLGFCLVNESQDLGYQIYTIETGSR